jgi:hypothetical protein
MGRGGVQKSGKITIIYKINIYLLD